MKKKEEEEGCDDTSKGKSNDELTVHHGSDVQSNIFPIIR